jgi:serine protease Do
MPEGTQGVVINAVDASSDSAAKGLQRGDIILSAGNRPVVTVADLETAVRAAKAANRAALLLRVQRRGQPAAFIPIRLR